MMAIIGMHALIYAKEDAATRAFFRDVLGFASVDAGRGWLIFSAPPSELAVHPAEDRQFHELYFMCDDIDATREELRAKGVETTAIQEQPWGRATSMQLPGGQVLGLYEPRHPTALRLS
jgi:hypothetical protein